jgi:hypothetical protein
MSLRENELHRSQHAQRQHHKKLRRRASQTIRTQKRKLDAPLNLLHDDQCLTFPEWCMLNGVSPRTGRRILKSPDGPVVTMLSAKRIGITVGNNRAWQASRARKVAA